MHDYKHLEESSLLTIPSHLSDWGTYWVYINFKISQHLLRLKQYTFRKILPWISMVFLKRKLNWHWGAKTYLWSLLKNNYLQVFLRKWRLQQNRFKKKHRAMLNEIRLFVKWGMCETFSNSYISILSKDTSHNPKKILVIWGYLWHQSLCLTAHRCSRNWHWG